MCSLQSSLRLLAPSFLSTPLHLPSLILPFSFSSPSLYFLDNQNLDTMTRPLQSFYDFKTKLIRNYMHEIVFGFGVPHAICVVTWNMNGKVPTHDLAELVNGDEKFDLLIIGLQEAPRGNIAQLFQEVLSESHSFLGESIMQSLQLFVFGLKKYEFLLNKEIKINRYDVGGLGGLLRRKKGAVAISIRVKGIKMMFISCHLSAHVGNVEERNSQVRDISHSIFSKYGNPCAKPPHITVWLGDLNYRIHQPQLRGLSML